MVWLEALAGAAEAGGAAEAAGGAEAAAGAGAAEAGAGEAAATEEASAPAGQVKNLNMQQFQGSNLKFQKGVLGGLFLGPQQEFAPRTDFDEPGYTS